MNSGEKTIEKVKFCFIQEVLSDIHSKNGLNGNQYIAIFFNLLQPFTANNSP